MAQGLFNKGPIAVAINAGKLGKYNNGIVTHENCNPRALDHGVLIVGYGS